MPRTWLAACLAVLLLLPSCSAPSGLLSVSGKVTIDGNPLPDGDIMFIPADKQFGAEAGKIKAGDGLNARPGQNRVEIRATRLVPGEKLLMGEPAIEGYIPARYNSAVQPVGRSRLPQTEPRLRIEIGVIALKMRHFPNAAKRYLPFWLCVSGCTGERRQVI